MLFEELNTVIFDGVLNTSFNVLSDEKYSSGLTPSHLVYGRSLFNSSKGVSSEVSTSNYYQKIVQHYVVITKHFKLLFINKCLAALHERHCYQNKRKSIKNNMKIIDVVLIKEKKLVVWNGRKWKLQILLKVKMG